MTIDSPFAALGNVSDTEEVAAQVDAIVRRFAPGHDLSRVDAAFSLLNRAFDGELPGYQKLKTLLKMLFRHQLGIFQIWKSI